MAAKFPILIIDFDRTMKVTLSYAARQSFSEAEFMQVYDPAQLPAFFEKFTEYAPRLVLLDINLRQPLDGLEWLRWLRSQELSRNLPVIVFTRSENQSDVEKAYAYGASSFTLKPFSLAEWRDYLRILRLYWVDVVTLPPGIR
ncbi:response regulator [Spirosoma sp.]|uniref:response regulator n=1 Tax=Spirosoma sp. TaxID=1899569 RepID=UPI003B3B6060